MWRLAPANLWKRVRTCQRRFAKMSQGKSACQWRCRSAMTSPTQSATQLTKRWVKELSFQTFCDKQVCEDVAREECTQVEKEQCSPKTVTECNDVTTEVCNSVPKEVCNLEKKIIMVEKIEEKCSAPADVPSTTTTTTVAPVTEKAVKPSNSYLPPPPSNAGKKDNNLCICIFMWPF